MRSYCLALLAAAITAVVAQDSSSTSSSTELSNTTSTVDDPTYSDFPTNSPPLQPDPDYPDNYENEGNDDEPDDYSSQPSDNDDDDIITTTSPYPTDDSGPYPSPYPTGNPPPAYSPYPVETPGLTTYETAYPTPCDEPSSGLCTKTYTVTEPCPSISGTNKPHGSRPSGHIPAGYTTTTVPCPRCKTPGTVTVTCPVTETKTVPRSGKGSSTCLTRSISTSRSAPVPATTPLTQPLVAPGPVSQIGDGQVQAPPPVAAPPVPTAHEGIVESGLEASPVSSEAPIATGNATAGPPIEYVNGAAETLGFGRGVIMVVVGVIGLMAF